VKLDPNMSNAHGQLAALICAVRAVLEINPATKSFAAHRIEQQMSTILTSPAADQQFLDGMEHVKAALFDERKDAKA
jgi:hypothetical protein